MGAAGELWQKLNFLSRSFVTLPATYSQSQSMHRLLTFAPDRIASLVWKGVLSGAVVEVDCIYAKNAEF